MDGAVESEQVPDPACRCPVRASADGSAQSDGGAGDIAGSSDGCCLPTPCPRSSVGASRWSAFTFTNLFGDDAVQLASPFDGVPSSAVDAALDHLRERFGSPAVTRGVLLGRREGLRVPLLPDWGKPPIVGRRR